MLNAKTRAFPLISGHNYQKVALEQSDVAALWVMEIKGMEVWVNLALQELSSNSLISIIPSALYQHFDCAALCSRCREINKRKQMRLRTPATVVIWA